MAPARYKRWWIGLVEVRFFPRGRFGYDVDIDRPLTVLALGGGV